MQFSFKIQSLVGYWNKYLEDNRNDQVYSNKKVRKYFVWLERVVYEWLGKLSSRWNSEVFRFGEFYYVGRVVGKYFWEMPG